MFLSTRRYRVYFREQANCWYVAYENGCGRQRKALSVRTKPEAEVAVTKLDERLHKPPEKNAATQQTRKTWKELQGMYLTHKASLGRAPKTIARYNSGLDAFGRFLKKQGVQFGDEVTLAVLDGYYAYRTQKEKRAMPTAFGDSIVVKNLLKWASRASRGLLPTNLAVDWETPRPVTPKRHCYTRDEVRAMEAGVRSWLREVVTVLAYTGMRIGELVNLRWKDVDLEKQIINIRIREDWKPKGKADRSVPLHPRVAAIIRSRPVGEYLFTGPRGGKLKQVHCLQALKDDQTKLKLTVSDLHSFRRFFATEMLRVGVDVETVRQWGGWKTLETMLRYLADVRAGDSIKAMNDAAAKLAAS